MRQLLTATILAAAASGSAHARQAATPADTAPAPVAAQAADTGIDTGTDAGIKDIVVTAQRRSESLQRAAVSVTAIGGDVLRDQARTTVDSALRDVPAVQIQGNANGAQVYVRGVGSNADAQLGDPAVNLNLDGVYQQETEVPTAILYDIDRVEVLRGPQGTLYGRNATAGAVNIITADPSLDAVHVGAGFQYGNYDAFRSEAMVNLPVTDTLALRGAFAAENHDGYLSNGNNNANTLAARLKALYKPNDRLRVLIAGDYLHIGDNGIGSVTAPLSSHPAYDSNKVTGYRNIDAWNVRAQVDYDLDWTTLSLLAAHNDYDKDEANQLLLPSAVSIHREGRQDSVELRATSANGSPVRWVAGLFYLHGLEVRQVVDSPIPAIAAPASDPELRDARSNSYAAFANVTVPLATGLRATGGLRYTHDRKSARFFYADTAAGSVAADTDWDSVTYKAGLEADIGTRSLVYGQVSSGYKAGGYAQQFPAATYNPERLTAFEIGAKNRFLDNRLQINASAFHYDYTNYQAQYPDLVGGSFALVTANAATARLYGGEVEATVKPGSRDTLTASLSYLHTRFGAFTYTSLLAGSVDHTGERLPAAPTWSGTIGYDHVFALAGGASVTAHVDTSLSSGYWTTVERSPDSYQSGFTRSAAFLKFQPASDRWDLRLFVRNIEDRAIRTLGIANPIDSVLLLAPPRTYGAAVALHF